MERVSLYFKLPDESNARAQIVEAIPDSWAWMDGMLTAPQALVEGGQVAVGCGFAVRRFHASQPTLIGPYSTERCGHLVPDLAAMMLEQKPPEFVVFDEAGFTSQITLTTAIRIAAGFIRKGYGNRHLRFYRDCRDNIKSNNSASCDIAFSPVDHGTFGEEQGLQPARIRLQWTPKYGGKPEHVEPIAAACRLLNLEAYVPSRPSPQNVSAEVQP